MSLFQVHLLAFFEGADAPWERVLMPHGNRAFKPYIRRGIPNTIPRGEACLTGGVMRPRPWNGTGGVPYPQHQRQGGTMLTRTDRRRFPILIAAIATPRLGGGRARPALLHGPGAGESTRCCSATYRAEHFSDGNAVISNGESSFCPGVHHRLQRSTDTTWPALSWASLHSSQHPGRCDHRAVVSDQRLRA